MLTKTWQQKEWLTKDLCKAVAQDASRHFLFEVRMVFYVDGSARFYVEKEMDNTVELVLEGFIDGWLCQYSFALKHLLKERGYLRSNS